MSYWKKENNFINLHKYSSNGKIHEQNSTKPRQFEKKISHYNLTLKIRQIETFMIQMSNYDQLENVSKMA